MVLTVDVDGLVVELGDNLGASSSTLETARA